MYYRSNETGRIISDVSIRVLEDIYGDGAVETAIKLGTIAPIENPSVIDCIRDSTRVTAIYRYREIHKCGLLEARTGVEALEKDMARFSKK